MTEFDLSDKIEVQIKEKEYQRLKLLNEIEVLKNDLCSLNLQNETIIIKELGIEATKVIHIGKSYNECMKLKPKGWRLLTLSEIPIIANNYEDSFEFRDGNHDFFFEQPFDINKKKNYVPVFFAVSGGLS